MALMSQRGRSFARSGSKSGWRRRRRNKAIRKGLGVTSAVMLAIVLYIWSPWSKASENAAPQTEVAEPVAANDTATLDVSASDEPINIPPSMPVAAQDDDDAEPEALDTIAASNTSTPDESVLETEGDGPVSLTMGEPIADATSNDAATTPADEETDSPEPVRAMPDLSLQRLESSPARPRPQASGIAFTSPDPVRTMLEYAVAAQDQNDPVEARELFNRALFDQRITPRDADLARERMSAINQLLVFSPTVVPNDPLAETYVIRSGDSLSKIAASNSLRVDWRFIQRINRISDPRRIRIGQSIKLIRGPFHAVVHKSAFRIDLFAQVNESAGGGLMFIDSFRVGLGEFDSTPAGAWIVRKNSRLINPPWTNPRTGEYFSADNPENPIGERWVGLEGVDDTTRTISGIGIHGTIEPESIGQEASMGCVRMLQNDVEITYELLVEGVSRVEIVP